jgi:predicted phage terminase large subunit-like protein
MAKTRSKSYLQLRAEAELELRRRQIQRKPAQAFIGYQAWLKQVTPNWVWNWDYQLLIQQHLNKITAGEMEKLMLFIPPRHGKSELVTVRYPVYRLEKNPGMRAIIGAYNQTLAEKFSRKSRRIASTRVALSNERSAVHDWETTAGGGMRAVGVGGGITGQGGDLIVIDDPVKNRKEAQSRVYRDAVYDWYTDDLYTRQEPGCAIILIMTRWHEDDLAGRILRSEDGPNWKVLRLPAEAEANDPLGRQVGEALNPQRYPLEALAKIKVVLKRSYWALYQQRPMEQEGDFFKRSWFEIVRGAPTDGAVYVRYWDRGATANDGDYTVGLLMARVGTTYYVIDVIRGQWSSGERDRIIKQTAAADRAKYSNVQIWLEQEPGSSGVDVINNLVTMLSGYGVHADKVTGEKAVRADPLASQAEVSNVKLVVGAWNEDFIDELTSFPNGANDDQVDAASGAFLRLADAGATWDDVRDLGTTENYSNRWS